MAATAKRKLARENKELENQVRWFCEPKNFFLTSSCGFQSDVNTQNNLLAKDVLIAGY